MHSRIKRLYIVWIAMPLIRIDWLWPVHLSVNSCFLLVFTLCNSFFLKQWEYMFNVIWPIVWSITNGNTITIATTWPTLSFDGSNGIDRQKHNKLLWINIDWFCCCMCSLYSLQLCTLFDCVFFKIRIELNSHCKRFCLNHIFWSFLILTKCEKKKISLDKGLFCKKKIVCFVERIRANRSAIYIAAMNIEQASRLNLIK